MNLLLALLLAALAAVPAAAHKAHGPEDLAGVGLDDSTGQKLPLDAQFTDENGVKRPLSAWVDRPALLLPVYYACREHCALMQENLALAMNQLALKPGRDFRAISLGFDPHEGPAAALSAKKTYLKLLKEESPPDSWKFLTGDRKDIKRVTDALGYRYKFTGDDFAHPDVLAVLARDGKIIRYIYGPEFLPFDTGMALTEAARGTPAVSIRKLVSYCFTYDPGRKTYTFQAARVLTAAVFLLTIAGMLLLLREKGPPQGRGGRA